MKLEQVFTGNIKICTKYERLDLNTTAMTHMPPVKCETKIYKQDVILIKIAHGGYVELERLKTIVDNLKIYHDILPSSYRAGGLMMATFPHKEGCLFIESGSLVPLYKPCESQKEVSIKQLKKELIK